MKDNFAVDELIMEIKRYAELRAKCVSEGLETPRLAALLLQKYGLGIVQAVAVIYERPKTTNEVYRVLDEETGKIDPKWHEHNKERWSGRPSDICINKDKK